MKYIVFTEIISKGSVTRWYYGTYENETLADNIAFALGHQPEEGIWHSICPLDEAEAYKILNMPKMAKENI